jgi:hypothetical protein
MENTLVTLLLLINIFFCLFIIIGSFLYFWRIKSKYRWVKLFWGLEMLVYILILVWSVLGGHTSQETQILFAMLPLSSLSYGLIVAFSRAKEANIIYELEKKLNGELEKWVTTQVNSMNKEK